MIFPLCNSNVRHDIVALSLCSLCGLVIYLSYMRSELVNTTLQQQIQWNPWWRKERIKKNNSVLIIYWTRSFNIFPSVNRDRYEWPYFYAGEECPIKCTLTTDKSRLNEATAIVVHARNAKEIPPSDQEPYKSLTWILHTNENPINAPELKNPEFMSKFHYLTSYRLDSDFPCPQFLKPSTQKPVNFDLKGFVIAVYSNCEPIRTAYISELMRYINVDSYGKCLHNKDGLKERDDPEFSTAVLDLQRHYKFTLVFPNSDCDYYMTEKIYNALSAGSVPVWLGTDDIDEVLQWGNLNQSVIKVNQFLSPYELSKYLLYLNNSKEEYYKYLKWKNEGFQFPHEYYFSAIGQWWDGMPLYCRICMKIAVEPRRHDGLDVDKCDGKQKRTIQKWFNKPMVQIRWQ